MRVGGEAASAVVRSERVDKVEPLPRLAAPGSPRWCADGSEVGVGRQGHAPAT
jgi:hypothetical protein